MTRGEHFIAVAADAVQAACMALEKIPPTGAPRGQDAVSRLASALILAYWRPEAYPITD